MNALIAWFATNRVAANLLMVLIVVAGLLSIPQTRKELIPNILLDRINIQIAYGGASPAEVEQSLCVPIEEKIFDLEGIRKLNTLAQESLCNITAEIEAGYASSDIKDKIESRIDAIDSFPKDAERPIIKEVAIRSSVISVVVSADVDEASLKTLAEQVRDDLTELKSVTQVDMVNSRPYEVSIELSAEALQKYALSFDEVAKAIRQSSINLPAGILKTDMGDVLLRTMGQAYDGMDYENLVLRSYDDGRRIVISDVAQVVDGFKDVDFTGEFNGQPGILLTVYRVGEQNILDIAEDVRHYVKIRADQLPPDLNIHVWQDKSVYFKGRMQLLLRNALTGLALVFFILVMFLRLRMALWISLGIPISFMGALWLLPYVGGSINMISMFAFILVLGIVVDDAIVVGENIHAQHRKGLRGLPGAIQGAQEVSRPVIFAVLTSVVAFMPILFLPGAEGRLWMVIPVVVITTLLFSLLECLFVLPAHLSSVETPPNLQNPFSRWQQSFSDRVEDFIQQVYRPFLFWALQWRYVVMAIFIALFLIFMTLVFSGWLKLAFFPKVEGDMAVASVSFPRGTPVAKTQQAVAYIEQQALALKQQLGEENNREQLLNSMGIIGMQPMSRSGKQGSHVGEVAIELAPSETRALSSGEILRLWRENVGEVEGASRLSFKATLRDSGPGISLELSGSNIHQLEQAGDALKQKLREYPSLYDIQDSSESAKKELQIRLKPVARQLGIDTQMIARQLRQAFQGEEVQRIQRGRDNVRVYVRYPASHRQSLYYLENMQIYLPSSQKFIPLRDIASLSFVSGPSEIRRIDRKRVIQISARVDESQVAAGQVMESLKADMLDNIPRQFPGVTWSKSGSQKDKDELIDSMLRGFVLALLGIYILMAIPFGSYVQPVMVMSAIPFGLIGAVLGHMLLGLDISLLSLSGMIAVAGVVVNDNLVLVDYINRNIAKGVPLARAIREAGVARFRPIILTSLTTFAGLSPLMMERSFQAKFLIPMAVSLGFGVMFATLVSLILVPASYFILEDIRKKLSSRLFLK